MKKNLQFLLFTFVLAFFFTATASAQTAAPDGDKPGSGGWKKEFPLKAKELDDYVAMLLPAVQKVREAAARQFETILKNTSALCRRVEAAGSNMSDAQLATFQREFSGIDTQIARFAAGQGSSAKSLEDCLKECGPSKNNPAAARCKFECIKGWLKMPDAGDGN